MSCKHFGKLTNSTRQCHCAKVLIWTMAAWPASTLQLAPALLIKILYLGSPHAGIQTLISWSHHQAWFGFNFAERDHCRARPNSYTARLFGEKEAATGFKIAQESWNLCHHSVMSILSLFCASPCIFWITMSPDAAFLPRCLFFVSVFVFVSFLLQLISLSVSLCLCYSPCPIFLLIPVANLEEAVFFCICLLYVCVCVYVSQCPC